MKFFVLAILVAFSLQAAAENKFVIVCKKSESFDETMEQINGLMIDQTWPSKISYTKDNKEKGTLSLNPKNLIFDTANIRYFESKEKITEGSGKKKTTREATVYNACIPVQYN